MSGPDSGREALLINAFVGLADTLVDDYDVIDVLDRLAGYSVQLLAAESVGILLADAQATLRVVASTNEQTEWMELLQLQADEGPCVECFRAGAPVNVDRPRRGCSSLARGSSLHCRNGVPTARCTRCRCGCAGRLSAP